MLTFCFSSVVLGVFDCSAYPWVVVWMIPFLWLGYVGYRLSYRHNLNAFLAYPLYFLTVNLASLIGVMKGLKGEVQATWDPTRMDCVGTGEERRGGSFLGNLGLVLSVAIFLACMVRIANISL